MTMPIPSCPKCQYCGQELNADECYDMEFDTSYATQYCIGTCSKCNITYQWIESYQVTYEGFCDLTETERN